MDPTGIQYDEQRRPFLWHQGQRLYISPVAMGGTAPRDETGIFRSRPQWNTKKGEWETPIDFGNIVTMGTAAALTGGMAHAAGAFGGAAGGTGGAAGSSGASGAAASGLPSYMAAPGVPYGIGAGTAAGFGAAPAVAGGGSGFASWLKSFIKNPKNLLGAAALVPAITNAFPSGGGGSLPHLTAPTLSPLGPGGPGPLGTLGVSGPSGASDALEGDVGLQRQRVAQTQQAFDTLVNMAYGTSPTRYRGNAPASYSAEAEQAPAGPYQYAGPRFG